MNKADLVGYYVFGIIIAIVVLVLMLLVLFYVIKWAVLSALRKYEDTSPRFDRLYDDHDGDGDPVSEG